MVAPNVTIERVLELADQLTPREQAELLVRIGQRLERVFSTAAVGSPEAVLGVIQSPPGVDALAVDEMEAAIRDGQRPAKDGGVFDDPHGV